MGKKALVFLAEGFEEVEAVSPIDYLRRAGVEVTLAAAGTERAVRGSHGITITADAVLAELEKTGNLLPASWDCVFVPGGMPGASNLAASGAAGDFFRAMAAAGKITAAICASPAVFLAPLGLLEGKRFTCYPGMEERIASGTLSNSVLVNEPVVMDGTLITSRGPGTAAAFALALVSALAGSAEADKLAASALLFPPPLPIP